MTSICAECHTHKLFGEKCWFFWQGKRSCSQYRKGPEEEPHFGTVDVPLSKLTGQH